MATHIDILVPMHVKVAITGAVTFTVDLSSVANDLETDDSFIQQNTVLERHNIELLVSAAAGRLGGAITITNPPTPTA